MYNITWSYERHRQPLPHIVLSVVSTIDAACDAVNILIVWNILYADNDVRYVLMYILYVRTTDKPQMQNMNEHMNNHSYVWT